MNKLFKQALAFILAFTIVFGTLNIINADTLAGKLIVDNQTIKCTVTATYVELAPLAKALGYTYRISKNNITISKLSTLEAISIKVNAKTCTKNFQKVSIVPIIIKAGKVLIPQKDITKLFKIYKYTKSASDILILTKKLPIPVVTPTLTPVPTNVPTGTPIPVTPTPGTTTPAPTVTPTPVPTSSDIPDLYSYLYDDYKTKNGKVVYYEATDYALTTEAGAVKSTKAPSYKGSAVILNSVGADLWVERASVEGNINTEELPWVNYYSKYWDINIHSDNIAIAKARNEVKRIFSLAWPNPVEADLAYNKYLKAVVLADELWANYTSYSDCTIVHSGIHSVVIGNRTLQVYGSSVDDHAFTMFDIKISKLNTTVLKTKDEIQLIPLDKYDLGLWKMDRPTSTYYISDDPTLKEKDGNIIKW